MKKFKFFYERRTTNDEPRNVLIAAGGTGGHVFPALAVATALKTRNVLVYWVGTAHGLETKVVPSFGFPLFFIHVTGLRGKGWLRALVMPFFLLFALYEAIFLILKIRPDVVLGMGGYVSGPIGIAAFLLRIPLVIQEQNAIAGFTNRWLSKIATRVLTGFPDAFPKNRKMVWTGNPIRQEIAGVLNKRKPITPMGLPFRLLVLGGSQGAQVFNKTIPEAIALLNEASPLIWHQTGAKEVDLVEAAYQKGRNPAKVQAFIHDMSEAYGWADLVICRAGALTISELTSAGIGAILVPFPFATDDHQMHNARYLSEAKAAVLLPQSQLTPQRLADLLYRFHQNRGELKHMGEKSASLARSHATEEVVDCLLGYS